MKKAYIFPGQGSQYPTMGKDLYEGSSTAKEMFDLADSILGFKITEIMFEGSDEDLRATRVTQPAIYLHSTILAAVYPDFRPDMVAGHSLGEFSALCASGAVSFEDGLRLVALRASEMQKCTDKVPGTMAAIIGLPNEKVEEVCAAVEGIVVPANYNSNGQVVISGEKEAVSKACVLAKEAGAKRALPLMVGGAFHSPLMEPARLELGKAIERTRISVPKCPIYQNVSAQGETDPARIKENLLLQLTSPVRWTQDTEAMLRDGATYFMEIGPGKVLQGLVRRTAGPDVLIEGISSLAPNEE